MQYPFAVAIVGPTATGKTAAGVAISRALRGEIISMDSMQVYRGMDIGTAKPTLSERQGIAHHLMDVVEPGAPFSAAKYRELADAAIDDILRRGNLPVLIGGTGLYLNAVTYAMDFAEVQGQGAFRSTLEAVATSPEGKLRLHERLQEVDPETARRLHPNDSRRVIRALEVHQETGRPMSTYSVNFSQEKRKIDPLVLGLTLPREELYRRINQRVESMMRQGLLDEARALYEAGVPMDSQAMQAIGYKELAAFFRGEMPLEDAVALIAQRSRQYAKRQWTWFRRDPRVVWFDLSEYEDAQTLYKAMLSQIEQERDQRKNETRRGN